MAEVITDFKEFLSEVQIANKYELPVEINGKTYTFVYSELTSKEDLTSTKEYEKWFKDNHPAIEKREMQLSEALDNHWRLWKMIRRHTKGMDVFEDFLALPPTVVTALMMSLQKDLSKRYPHLKGK